MNRKEDISFNKSEKAFKKFVRKYANNKDFKDKYVGFYDGEFVAIMDWEGTIVKHIYDKFGNVPCYVGKITNEKRICIIEEVIVKPLNGDVA